MKPPAPSVGLRSLSCARTAVEKSIWTPHAFVNVTVFDLSAAADIAAVQTLNLEVNNCNYRSLVFLLCVFFTVKQQNHFYLFVLCASTKP